MFLIYPVWRLCLGSWMKERDILIGVTVVIDMRQTLSVIVIVISKI